MTQQAGESTITAVKAMTTSPMLLMGSKRRKQLAGQLQESVSAPASDFAQRQLERMGWTAGTGLGKKRNGIVEHIKVKKRVEQAGLGTEKQAVQAQATAESWWKDSLGDTLAKLASSKKGRTSKKRKKVYTDEELFEATGGARFGTKGGKLRQAKWRRTETTSFDENKTDEVTSDQKEHAVMEADKLFKEETLNEETKEVSSDTEKAKKPKDKKKKKSKKDGKKEKKEKKKKSKKKEE